MKNEKGIDICPLCKSDDISDDSMYNDNGIYGPGGKRWRTTNIRSCNKCGIVFKPIDKKQPQL